MRLTRTERVVFVWLAWASLAGLCCATWRLAVDVSAWIQIATERNGEAL